MADIVQTPANVLPYSGYGEEACIAGETLVAGDVGYLKSSDTRIWKADASTAVDATAADVYGICLCGASAGQPVMVQRSGDINPGGTVAVGEIYALSNSGKIAPEGDLVATDWVTLLGVGVTASKIHMTTYASGIAHA